MRAKVPDLTQIEKDRAVARRTAQLAEGPGEQILSVAASGSQHKGSQGCGCIWAGWTPHPVFIVSPELVATGPS